MQCDRISRCSISFRDGLKRFKRNCGRHPAASETLTVSVYEWGHSFSIPEAAYRSAYTIILTGLKPAL